MSDKKPVVIYGASGYTGKLVAEYLREYQLPFIAAGRNLQRIEEALALVPGIETADYDIVEVEHTVDALTELFTGCKVVCNTVGPFDYFGDVVVEAAANANCHYMDTTGEQAFMLRVRDKFGDIYQANGKVLAPSTAYMYTPLDIASHIVLEEPGIDTLDAACIASGVPTYGSTQTIFAMFQAEHLYLEDNQLQPWVKGRGWEVSAPGKMMTQLAHPWGGGSLPVWFQRDGRVHTARQLTAFTNRPMYESLIELQKHYEDNIKPLPKVEQEVALKEIAEGMQPGMPPRENRLVNRTVDFVHGTGSGVHKTCVINTTVPYQLTGVVQAALASYLVKDEPLKTGFVSACQAVGYPYMLGALQNFIPLQIDIS
ncbi:MAG TPA: saccharopine dehydrogenase [Porticoccus sp.]|nr:saccharopine dehydrogenase [Porticoccus sp.]